MANKNPVDIAAREFFKNGLVSVNALQNQLRLRESVADTGVNQFMKAPAKAEAQIDMITKSIKRNMATETNVKKLSELGKLYLQEVATWEALKKLITGSAKDMVKLRAAGGAANEIANFLRNTDESIKALKSVLKNIQSAERMFLPRSISTEFLKELPKIKAKKALQVTAA